VVGHPAMLQALTGKTDHDGKPENSIVKYQPGDEIKLKQEDFLKLSKAFFAEIESKYL